MDIGSVILVSFLVIIGIITIPIILEGTEEKKLDTDCTKIPISYEIFKFCDFSGVNLSNKNLIGITLSGSNLSGANLEGSDLTGAYLNGINFTNANMQNNIINLIGWVGWTKIEAPRVKPVK